MPVSAKLVMIGVFILTALASTATCSMQDAVKNPGESPMAGKTIEAVMTRHSDALMSLRGVVGVAIGDCGGTPCIKVFVAKKTPELSNRIPSTLEGFPVEVVETGKIRALESR